MSRLHIPVRQKGQFRAQKFILATDLTAAAGATAWLSAAQETTMDPSAKRLGEALLPDDRLTAFWVGVPKLSQAM